MHKKNVVIYIVARNTSFLASEAIVLSEKFNIIFIAKDKYALKAVKGLCREIKHESIIEDDFIKNIPKLTNVISECMNRERKYKILFSMLCSFDRALGKGYVFNADRHPDVIRSWWPSEDKYEEILKKFIFWENAIERFNPVLISGVANTKIIEVISKYHNIKYLTLGMMKFGNRYFWVDNSSYTSSVLIESTKKFSVQSSSIKDIVIDYERDKSASLILSKQKITYKQGIKEALDIILRDTYSRVKGTRRKKSYRYLGWLPSRLRRPYIFKYFLRQGKAIEDLRKKKIILVPLHLEPEVSLSVFSPEFNNCMEMIVWLSKSAPADTVIVVREHPLSFGIRSKQYYDNFRRMANVVLADPTKNSWEWIKASNLIGTITSTVGIEAVYFNKPIISFGKHQIINYLPTVRYVENYDSTSKAVNELLSLKSDDKIFELSRKALYKAQMEVSFELPGIEKLQQMLKLKIDLGRIAVKKLYEQYPGLID